MAKGKFEKFETLQLHAGYVLQYLLDPIGDLLELTLQA